MKDFFNCVYNTLEKLWEYYKDMYAVGIVKQAEATRRRILRQAEAPAYRITCFRLTLRKVFKASVIPIA